MTAPDKIEDPSFGTRWIVGPLVILAALLVPYLWYVHPSKNFALHWLVAAAFAGTLFGLGLMWPRQRHWAHRMSLGAIGISALLLPIGFASELHRYPNSWLVIAGSFVVPTMIAVTTTFFAVKGRWPRWAGRKVGE